MHRLLLPLFFLFSTSFYSQDVSVTGFDGEIHTGASTISKVVEFPEDLSGFGQILMDVNLSCPPGGCDPWDRFAQLSVLDDNGITIEIGRYITPYGNDWCEWTIDVSDYRELLSGTTEIVSHIETWINGWNIHTEFHFIEGSPDYEHVAVSQFFKENQFTYGDTLFYPIDLPAFDMAVPDNAEEVVFRIFNTGHGQGNTQNAAEFSQMTHGIHVNGNEEFEQYLWYSDCENNPCSPQGGNWQFDRAGWCPGEDVTPWDYDITSFSPPGGSVNLDYVLQPFYNECSPWNPDCTGATCPECTYNNQTHTTPVYKIVMQMIVKSSSPLSLDDHAQNELGIAVYPNPSSGVFKITSDSPTPLNLEVLDITGEVVREMSLLTSGSLIDLSEESEGIYLLRFYSDEGMKIKRVVID